jgi:hypothetical protein
MARTAVRKTPQEATEKWVTALGQAGPEIEAGVKRVQTAPGQLAAAQKAKYLAAVQEKVNKWANNVGRVSLQEWQDHMLKLGVPRVAQGAQEKRGKMEAFQAEFFPYLDRVMAEAARMPTTTKAQRIQKMVAVVTKTGEFQRGGGGAGRAAGQ